MVCHLSFQSASGPRLLMVPCAFFGFVQDDSVYLYVPKGQGLRQQTQPEESPHNVIIGLGLLTSSWYPAIPSQTVSVRFFFTDPSGPSRTARGVSAASAIL